MLVYLKQNKNWFLQVSEILYGVLVVFVCSMNAGTKYCSINTVIKLIQSVMTEAQFLVFLSR